MSLEAPEPEPTEATAATPPPRGGGRFVLMRVAGLDVEGHLILLPLLALIGFVLATSLLPGQEDDAYTVGEYWLMGAIGSLLLLVSVFAHELSHALTARAQGHPVQKVSLFFHGERFDERHEGRTPASELIIAGVGPATSIVIGAAGWAAGHAVPDTPLVTPLLQFVGVTNLLLGFFSLIPAFPLDGGRMLRAFFWQLSGTRLQATRFTCIAGRLIAALFFAIAIAQGLVAGFSSGSFWFLALALLMHLQAGATWRLARVREGLDGCTVGQLLEPLPPVVPRQVSAQDALFSPEFADLRESGRGYLVEFQGRLGGVATLRDLRRIPEDERAGTPVWEVTTRLRREHLLDPEMPAGRALERLLRTRLPLLPVYRGGELLGVVSRDALERAIDERLARRGGDRNPPAPAA